MINDVTFKDRCPTIKINSFNIKHSVKHGAGF